MLKHARMTIALLVTPLGLAACGGGGSEPAAGETVTVTATVTADPSPDASAETTPAAPNVGDLALKVGDWREGTGVRTRVIEVRQPGQGRMPDYLDGEADAVGATVLIRSCVREGSESAVVSSIDFTGRDKDGAVYENASSSWDVWPPLPQYPTEREVRAGQCVQGWVLISTPENTRVTTIELGGGGDGVLAEWMVP